MRFRIYIILFYASILLLLLQNFNFNPEQINQLSQLNTDFAEILNHTKDSIPSELPSHLMSQVKSITSVCLDETRNDQLIGLINEQYKAGNTGPVLGFLLQKFRIGSLSLDLEKEFNQTCQTLECRQRIISQLSNVVKDQRSFALMFEAQFYPRVFHIENIPNIQTTPVQISQIPKRMPWMTDDFYSEEIAQFQRDHPIISNDYRSSSGHHRWRESIQPRQFPRNVGFQNQGYLSSNNQDYLSYSFCDDDLDSSYSPNFWPINSDGQIGEMKTYLGCHGSNLFLFPSQLPCQGSEQHCEEGKLFNEFELTKDEVSCFQRRLFNPNPRRSRANSTPHLNPNAQPIQSPIDSGAL